MRKRFGGDLQKRKGGPHREPAMDRLKETLEQNKERYIERLKDLIAIDTHDIGHGIGGGLEKEGQDYMIRLFEDMGADQITKDPMEEQVIK